MSFKRQADTELNQDNVHEMDKEVSDKAKHDTWKKAPDDVLATRKILKVSDGFSKPTEPAATSGGFAAYAKINPFAAMGPPMGFSSSNKTTAPSIVTSATGNGAAKLVPEATSSPKTNPFGAPSPAHNPFMNFVGENKPNVDYWQKFKEPIKVAASESVSSSDVKVTFVNPSSTSNKQSESTSSSSVSTNSCGSSTSGGGDEKKDVSNASTSDSESANKDDEGKDEGKDEDKGAVDDSSSSVISEKKPAIDTAAMFCKPTELDNGEAGEECVLKLRAKLYRLTDVEKSSTKEWVEMGTGPVRLLTPSTALDSASSQASEAPLFPRVVMRREHQAGGPGTKVILNALFRSHFSVAKMGERAARLTCLAVPPEVPKSLSPDEITISPETKDTEDVKPVAIPMTFLFKMQHSHEADQFIKHINTFLEKSNAEDKKD